MNIGKFKNVLMMFFLAGCLLFGFFMIVFINKPQFFSKNYKPCVVFISAEDEYKASRTLPDFAHELRVKYGLSCKVLQGGVEEQGEGRNSIEGMEVLGEADLVVLFVRRRALPEIQMKYFREYLAGGKPLVALRTSSHAFNTRGNVPAGHVDWIEFDPEVLGGNYHGHRNEGPLCSVMIAAGAENHPILAGVQAPFTSKGSLYEVQPLAKSTRILLFGTIAHDEPEPVAWTNRYGRCRVFYTSLGHPDDFENEQFRRMLINAVFWAMDIEPHISRVGMGSR